VAAEIPLNPALAWPASAVLGVGIEQEKQPDGPVGNAFVENQPFKNLGPVFSGGGFCIARAIPAAIRRFSVDMR